jgi:hypothetical protein
MNNKTKLISTVLFLLVFIMLVSCRQKKDKVERIFEDGVEVVINHLEPYKMKGEPSNLTIEEEFKIDLQSNDIAEIGLTNINDFVVDSEGNLYFLNMRSNEEVVFQFDRNGSFVNSFVRKGQGPGEIQFSYYLRINNQDEIIIADPMSRKLLILSKDGDVIRETRLDSNVNGVFPLENGNYLIQKYLRGPDENIREFLLVLCSPEFQEIKVLKKIENPVARPGSSRIKGIYSSFALHPNFVWCVSKRNILVEERERGYEISVCDLEGNLQRKVRKEYTPINIPEEYKKKFLKEIESVAGEELRKKVYFPKYWPPFRYFFTDDNERIFVMTYEKGKNQNEYQYDIFNSRNLFVGRISLGNIQEIPLGELELAVKARNNRLYCLKEKESGYKELVVYKMRWE